MSKNQGDKMVDKKMYRKIQSLKKRGYGKDRIKDSLKLDPATVRKYFNMGPSEYEAYQKSTLERQKIFEGYEKEVLDVYRENGNQRLSMSAVYDFLEERHKELPGSEKSFRNFIHHLEKAGKLRYAANLRLYQKVEDLPFGRQMQLDFGEYKQRNGKKLYIFGAVLSASRYKYGALQERPFTTLDVILHLLDCFDYFGGMPEEMVIDQDSLMVVDENHGEIIYTRAFETFLHEMELKMYVCRKADPESKGKVENLIKYVKYNFLQVRNFHDLEEAREAFGAWLTRRANGKICQATGRVPGIVMEEERKHLRPMKNSLYRRESYLGREERMVSDKSFIMVESNEYSVPVEYRNKNVEIYKTDHELCIFDARTGKEICRHAPCLKTGQKVADKTHFRRNSISLNELEKKARELSDCASWRIFLDKNRETYPRYFRDQCLLAVNSFASLSEDAFFQMALDYCIENKTYAMNALQDTYLYHLKEHEREEKIIQTAFGAAFTANPLTKLSVSKRSVESYESLFTPGQGGRR